MRIPISIFLAIWAVFMLVFLITSTLTVYQMKKYAIRGPGATVPTAMFIGVSSVILIVTILYLMMADWSRVLDLGGIGAPSAYIPL